MIKILFGEKFQKVAKKFFKKHPNIYSRYTRILDILQNNPHHPSLRLHKLSGKLNGFYSVSITMQYRITLEFYIEEDSITLVNIGSHDEVYD